MKLQRICFVLFLVTAGSFSCLSQASPKISSVKKASPNSNAPAVKSSAAYAEVLLRKTDLEATLEDLLVSYNDDYPKIKETRYELGLIGQDIEKILAVSETSKLTLALGKLIVRRAELETDLWALQSRYSNEHPEVKRARRKADTFDKSVKEILP